MSPVRAIRRFFRIFAMTVWLWRPVNFADVSAASCVTEIWFIYKISLSKNYLTHSGGLYFFRARLMDVLFITG